MARLTRNALSTAVPAIVALMVALAIWIWGAGSPTSATPLSAVDLARAYSDALYAADHGDELIAEQILRSIRTSNPEHHKTVLLLGQLCWNRRDREAFDLWSTIPPDAGQDYALACYLTGAAYLDLGDDRSAESFLQSAIASQPGYGSAIDALLDLYAIQRRAADMRRLLAERIVHSGPTPRLLALDLLAGKEIFSRQQSLDALRHFHTTNPPTTATSCGLALTLWEMGEQQTALDQTTSTAIAAPNKSDNSAAGAHDVREDSDSARLRAIRLQILTELGEWSASAGLANEICSNPSVSPIELQALGTWCLRQGTASVAQDFLLAALSELPLDAAAWSLAGQAAAQRGDAHSADVCLAHAITADELERDAYLVLRGTQDTQLLSATMHRVADGLVTLSQSERAAMWSTLASELTSGNNLRPSNAVISQYTNVLTRPANNSVVPEPTSPAEVWNVGNRDTVHKMAQKLFADERAPSGSLAEEDSLRRGFQFEDVAARSGLKFRYDPGQSGKHLIVETIGGGVCVLDFDGDHRPDLFFPQGGQAALLAAFEHTTSPTRSHSPFGDRLFRNMGDNSFQDVSQDAGIGGDAYSLGCAAADLDNDGDPDIVVGTIGDTRVYRNQGDGTFDRDVLHAGQDSVTAAVGVGDFNNDGAPDLWLVNYVDEWRRTCLNADREFSVCLPASYPPQTDTLLLSTGDNAYSVISADQISPLQGRGLGIVTLDVNEDGRTDAYVANDGSPNQLFLSSGSANELPMESALTLGCALSGEGRAEAGMGICVADFDNDLQPDFFVTNFHQESNRLYTRMKSGQYIDASARWNLPSLTLPVLGFGVQSADFNRDGFSDVVIANGHINDYRRQGQPYQMQPLLLTNVRGQHFDRVSGGDYFNGAYLGRGVALLDYNNDRRLDVVVVHQDRNVALLENAGPSGNILQIRLAGGPSSRDAVNAVIDVVTQNQTCRQWNVGSHGYMATNERVFRFVTGSAPVDEIHIRWPSGRVSRLEQVRPDSSLVIREDGVVRTIGIVVRLLGQSYLPPLQSTDHEASPSAAARNPAILP